ncbi:DUF2789 domain-containing protein [Xanthomonas sp. CFBP 8445]|uniref:DUF2789 domain-containing protein n=1 Tax=Xanthomonas sp. CFBP 8445 TaxID=2971236 RepID=UPI0021DFBD80|nr:DUF2789 domain-containing protein [Xanthomonas sp. CFBP 8445]UYC10938.1 DUF2789 domain-containing protein [Xanthomonas sp. CFBP 8445]
MEPVIPPFADLFAQLGLPNSEGEIRQFIAQHAPLPDDMRLEEAPFWTPAQAQLLREERLEDADWAVVVDQFNIALHARPEPGADHAG